MLLSCGGGGGGGSDDEDASSTIVSSVSNGITGSSVFIDGRTVTIWARWCSDHEVTQAEYQSVMGSNPSYFSGTNKPVEQVSWYDAITYCNKRSIDEGYTPCYTISGSTNPDDWADLQELDDASCNFSANGYRLPTEAEWEYFARGGNVIDSNQTIYSGSNEIDEVAWYSTNSGGTTHEVKTTSKANVLNLYDMSGNVWEWCWDRYGSISASTDSAGAGASSGTFRVLRGGGWNGDASHCSVAIRTYEDPYNHDNRHLGFRVVRTAN